MNRLHNQVYCKMGTILEDPAVRGQACDRDYRYWNGDLQPGLLEGKEILGALSKFVGDSSVVQIQYNSHQYRAKTSKESGGASRWNKPLRIWN